LKRWFYWSEDVVPTKISRWADVSCWSIN
jgi:hypothetical protein